MISVPVRLRVAIGLIFLSIPWVLLEIALVARAPWWKLPVRSMTYWGLIFMLVCIPLSVWMAAGRKWAYTVSVLLSGVWLTASIWLAVVMRLPSLAFFSFCLLIFLMGELFWLKLELERSYMDPQMKWYHGAPKRIPGLECKVNLGDFNLDFRVSRMDRDGAFVMVQSKESRTLRLLPSFLLSKDVQLVFCFRHLKIACPGVPTLSMNEGLGIGIRFHGLSPDSKKEIGDFVEVLRGEGYV